MLTAAVSMPIAGRFNPGRDGPKWFVTFNQLTAQLNAAPGVAAAGAVSSLPLSGATEGGGLRVTGRAPDPPGMGPHAQYNVVSGNYFTAARVPVIAGRAFDARDDAPGVGSIIVNREFVRRYYASESDALGRTVTPTFTFTSGKLHTIVGIVANVKQESLEDDPQPHFLGWLEDVDPDELFASGAAWGIQIRRAAP